MRVHFAIIPALDPGRAAEELNRFLASTKVLSIDRHLVGTGAESFWAVCVTHVEGGAVAPTASAKRARVDFREVLSEADFAVYARLRAIRKSLVGRVRMDKYAGAPRSDQPSGRRSAGRFGGVRAEGSPATRFAVPMGSRT